MTYTQQIVPLLLANLTAHEQDKLTHSQIAHRLKCSVQLVSKVSQCLKAAGEL